MELAFVLTLRFGEKMENNFTQTNLCNAAQNLLKQKL